MTNIDRLHARPVPEGYEEKFIHRLQYEHYPFILGVLGRRDMPVPKIIHQNIQDRVAIPEREWRFWSPRSPDFAGYYYRYQRYNSQGDTVHLSDERVLIPAEGYLEFKVLAGSLEALCGQARSYPKDLEGDVVRTGIITAANVLKAYKGISGNLAENSK